MAGANMSEASKLARALIAADARRNNRVCFCGKTVLKPGTTCPRDCESDANKARRRAERSARTGVDYYEQVTLPALRHID
jgi:hypothetical protein